MQSMNKIKVPFYEIFLGGKNCFSMTVIEPTNMTEELNQRERSEQTFKIEIVFILRDSLENVCAPIVLLWFAYQKKTEEP